MGSEVAPPTRRAVALAVIENPFAGKYQEDLSDLMAIGEELGGLLTEKCVAALGIEGGKAESFGKAAIVGEKGELEHAAAILHPKMGTPVRKVLVKGAALIPSAKKMGGPGTAIDVPLGPQGCGLRALAFRCDRGARLRCAARATRSWWRSPSPIQRPAACRASAACRSTRSRARTGCGRRSTLFHDLRDAFGGRRVAAAPDAHDAVDHHHADARQVADLDRLEHVLAGRMLRPVDEHQIAGLALLR